MTANLPRSMSTLMTRTVTSCPTSTTSATLRTNSVEICGRWWWGVGGGGEREVVDCGVGVVWGSEGRACAGAVVGREQGWWAGAGLLVFVVGWEAGRIRAFALALLV